MLLITAEIRQFMVTHAQEGYPNEVCGLLGGLPGRALDVRAVRNVAERPIRQYRMDPEEQWAAFQSYESAGWELLAVYHSHPSGPAHPSETDIAECYYPDMVYFIVSLDRWETPSLTAWQIDSGAFHPAAWQVVPD